jgi:virginiamycin B lyase
VSLIRLLPVLLVSAVVVGVGSAGDRRAASMPSCDKTVGTITNDPIPSNRFTLACLCPASSACKQDAINQSLYAAETVEGWQGEFKFEVRGPFLLKCHANPGSVDIVDPPITVRGKGAVELRHLSGRTQCNVKRLLSHGTLVLTDGPTVVLAHGPDPYVVLGNGKHGAVVKVLNGSVRVGRLSGSGQGPLQVTGLVTLPNNRQILVPPTGPLGSVQPAAFTPQDLSTATKLAAPPSPPTTREFSAGLSPTGIPTGIATGPDSNTWFTDSSKSAPGIGTINGIGTISPEYTGGLNATPLRITDGPDAKLWFTERGSVSAIGTITALGTPGAITEYSYANGLEASSQPFEITTGGDGNLWFTDQGTPPAIGTITQGGAITEFTKGLRSGSHPVGIATDRDGNVWFTDDGTVPAIGEITPSGTITEYTSGLNQGSRPGELTLRAEDGSLWFTDDGSTPAIGMVNPTTGAIVEFSAGLQAGSKPNGIAAGSDGNVWFTDDGTAPAIGRITAAGVIDEFSHGLNPGSAPDQIAAGTGSSLWFTDSGTTRAIGRVTPSG